MTHPTWSAFDLSGADPFLLEMVRPDGSPFWMEIVHGSVIENRRAQGLIYPGAWILFRGKVFDLKMIDETNRVLFMIETTPWQDDPLAVMRVVDSPRPASAIVQNGEWIHLSVTMR